MYLNMSAYLERKEIVFITSVAIAATLSTIMATLAHALHMYHI